MNFPLSEAGRFQANRLRSRLQREKYAPTRIYSSPLSRALETARIASSIWGLPVEMWEDLTEIDVGVVSGLTDAEIEERFPEFGFELTTSRNLELVGGAETYGERIIRAQRVVDSLIREHKNNDRVLIFSHGGILTHIIARILGTDRIWDLGIHNTAVFEFSIDVDRWHLSDGTRDSTNFRHINCFNDASHLGETLS